MSVEPNHPVWAGPPARRPFSEAFRPLPPAKKCGAVVLADGRHYASFVDRDHAIDAVALWYEADPPALRGKRLDVVDGAIAIT